MKHKARRRGLFVALNSLRHFGIFVMPLSEIEQMERGAESDYAYMKSGPLSERERGYFNGMADYASKTAVIWKNHYMPNV